MAAFTSYLQNKTIDALFRGQSLGAPSTWYLGLLVIQGIWQANTVYTSGQFVVPPTGNGRVYKCTTGGTSGSGQPTWPTTNGGTVNDGTVVWTEQTTNFLAGTLPPEVSGGSYGRVSQVANLGNFAGTQGAGSTTASSGNSGQTSNNNVLPWPVPSANWGTVGILVWYDAPTGGNIWAFEVLTNPQTVNNGNAAPTSAIAAVVLGFNNAV